MNCRALLLIFVGSCALLTFSNCGSDSPTSDDSTRTIVDTVVLRDYEYADGRIYDLLPLGYIGPTDRVIDLKVFEGRISGHPSEVYSLPTAALKGHPDSIRSAQDLVCHVKQIDSKRTAWFDDPTTGRHIVVFDTARDVYPLGVWMRIEKCDLTGNALDTFEIGHLDEGDTLLLKCIRHFQFIGSSNPAWGLVWRNCYSVPKNLTLGELNLKVFKGTPGTEGTEAAQDYLQIGTIAQSYLQILGLDQCNNETLERRPDKVLDELDGVYRPDLGLIIFPSRTPFDSDTTYYDEAMRASLPLPERVSNIYDYTSSSGKTGNSQYFITYEQKIQVPR